MAAREPEKRYNPFMKSEAFGNILDSYDNVTYSIRLFMVKKEDIQKWLELDPSTGYAVERPSGVNLKSGTVILAQTGVTGTTIDNLTVAGMIRGTHNATDINFQIAQPGAASFLDHIMMAKAHLGYKFDSTTVLMMLEVRFQGYLSSTNIEEDGKPEVIAGPYRYAISLTGLTVEINQQGSLYDVSAFLMQDIGIQDRDRFTLPKDTITRGAKIEEQFESLKESLNHHFSQAESVGVPDTVEFDLSQLIGTSGTGIGSDRISDTTLITPAEDDVDKLNRASSLLNGSSTATEHNEKLKQEKPRTGLAPEFIIENNEIKFTEGCPLDQWFATILSMNKEVYKKITRRADPFDEESTIDTKQAYVSWFKFHGKVELGEYDYIRKDWAKKYTFTPVLYKTLSDNVGYDPKEKETTPEDVESRIKQIVSNLGCLKQYEYIFTGRNTDIINMDLKFDAGLTLLAAPRGGRIGSFQVVEGKRSAPIKPDEDITIQGQVNTVNKETEANKIEGAKNQIAGIVNKVQEAANKLGNIDTAMNALGGALDTLINEISGAVGVPADTLKGLIKSNDSTGISNLIDSTVASGDSKAINKITNVGEANAASAYDTTTIIPTESTAFDDYTPKASAYTYAPDLAFDSDFSPSAEDLQKELAQQQRATSTALANAVKAGTTMGISSTKVPPNKVANATQIVGNPHNTLFGVYTEQNASDQVFLSEIQLSLRGDPWFLGRGGIISYDNPNPKMGNFTGDTQCFWLTIRAPQAYDPDVVEEDNNTGYWKFGNMSQTFSGLYNINEVTHNFSGGLYTIDLKAHRNTSLGVEKIIPDQNASAAQKEQSSLDELQAKIDYQKNLRANVQKAQQDTGNNIPPIDEDPSI